MAGFRKTSGEQPLANKRDQENSAHRSSTREKGVENHHRKISLGVVPLHRSETRLKLASFLTRVWTRRV